MVYGDLLDAHFMHNPCTERMLRKRIRIELLNFRGRNCVSDGNNAKHPPSGGAEFA